MLHVRQIWILRRRRSSLQFNIQTRERFICLLTLLWTIFLANHGIQLEASIFQNKVWKFIKRCVFIVETCDDRLSQKSAEKIKLSKNLAKIIQHWDSTWPRNLISQLDDYVQSFHWLNHKFLLSMTFSADFVAEAKKNVCLNLIRTSICFDLIELLVFFNSKDCLLCNTSRRFVSHVCILVKKFLRTKQKC